MDAVSELHEFMQLLYQAGMSADQVVESGFSFACFQTLENNALGGLQQTQMQLIAARAVHQVARELGLPLQG